MATLMDFIMQQVGGRAPVTPTPERQQMFDTLSSYGAGAQPPERQQMFGTLSSYGAGMPISQPPPVARPVPMPMLVGQPMPSMPQPMAQPMPAAPLPPPRSTAPAGAPMQLAGGQPSVREGFMQRLLGGPDYQSNNMPVVAQPQGPMGREMQGAPMPMQAKPMTAQDINWGNPENAADFFRADRALQNLPPEVLRGLLG